MGIKHTERITRSEAIEWLSRKERERVLKIIYAKYDGYTNKELEELMDKYPQSEFENYFVVDDSDKDNEDDWYDY